MTDAARDHQDEAVSKQLVNESASADARSLKTLLDLMLNLEARRFQQRRGETLYCEREPPAILEQTRRMNAKLSPGHYPEECIKAAMRVSPDRHTSRRPDTPSLCQSSLTSRHGSTTYAQLFRLGTTSIPVSSERRRG
jgi:hypothetical protein